MCQKMSAAPNAGWATMAGSSVGVRSWFTADAILGRSEGSAETWMARIGAFSVSQPKSRSEPQSWSAERPSTGSSSLASAWRQMDVTSSTWRSSVRERPPRRTARRQRLGPASIPIRRAAGCVKCGHGERHDVGVEDSERGGLGFFDSSERR